jgi:hypothetical protein
MDFRQLSPIFCRNIGEKSAPVVGLNDVFRRFQWILEVVESPFAEAFESAAYANFATPARTSTQRNISQIKASTAVNLRCVPLRNDEIVTGWEISEARLNRFVGAGAERAPRTSSGSLRC